MLAPCRGSEPGPGDPYERESCAADVGKGRESVDSHKPIIPVVTGALTVTIQDGEIILATQHDYASLTADAARATGQRLIEAADCLHRT